MKRAQAVTPPWVLESLLVLLFTAYAVGYFIEGKNLLATAYAVMAIAVPPLAYIRARRKRRST